MCQLFYSVAVSLNYRLYHVYLLITIIKVIFIFVIIQILLFTSDELFLCPIIKISR